LSNNPLIIGIVLLVFGIITTFFGGKWFKYILPTIVAGIVFTIVMLLASVTGALTALDKGTTHTPGQITITVLAFVVSFTLAIFAGWFIKKIERLGIALLGATAGFFLGFLLYTFVFAQFL
jgi:uncharacterized membrane protein